MSDNRPTTYPGVILRPSRKSDLEFLYRVYAWSRYDKMAMIVDWSEEQKEELLRSQFKAQHTYYLSNYPNARYDIVIKDGEEIGRLYVEHTHKEIRIMDIALLPEHRNLGIGGTLIREVLAEAERSHRVVSLHVEAANPARRLYERMGFAVAGELAGYKLMYRITAEPALGTGSRLAYD